MKREGNRYTVLTAWHVVEDNNPGEELAIFTPDGKEHQLEQGSIQRLGQVDMAVLSFSSGSSYEVAAVGDIKKVKHDQPIYVAGFPLNNSQNLRYEPGEVVANAEVGIDQGYQLLYDNKTESGMSGGVLLNADGELIGLHGRGERNEQSSSGKEFIAKTGVNQGVPITYYNLFASGAPVVVAKTTATSADDYLAQARASAGIKGREQTVIRLAEQSLKFRESVEGYFLIGTNKNELGDQQEAIADFNKAIAINPQIAPAYNNRGKAKMDLGDNQGAIADYSKAIAINPQYAYAYTNRGSAKMMLGDLQGAIADINKAISINPQFAGAYSKRGVAKFDLRDYQGAIADYDKSIDINPEDTLVYQLRGIAKAKTNDHQAAISDYTKAIDIDPQAASAYSFRGMARFKLGDFQGTIADYSKSLEINPQNKFGYYNRGMAKKKLKDYQGAIADYTKAIEIDPQYADAHYQSGLVNFVLKDYLEAIDNFSKTIEIDPRNAGAYEFRGMMKWVSGNRQAGCLDIKKASLLGKESATSFFNKSCR
ncbi:tetratricopeptide repeat protein [Prochlorococcus sp. MIT 0703]|uniref:tetratricopeptide repeat protein n=1 Tax=unclassified Prochlorococcus TaxID=2627481 RepID=UPI0039A62285